MGKVWFRTRYVSMRNAWTGKVVVVDTFERRLYRMKDRVFEWARVVDEWRRSHKSRMVMVTLTYRRKGDYRPGHIGDYMRNLKRRLGDDLYAFAWVAELQERGAVHYHVILVVRPGADIPMPDKKGYWTHGMSKIGTARTAFYLVSYTGKKYQKDLQGYPKSCRLYAVSIRPILGSLRRSCGQVGPKIRTSEGGPIWEYVGSGVSRDYVDLVSFPSKGTAATDPAIAGD